MNNLDAISAILETIKLDNSKSIVNYNFLNGQHEILLTDYDRLHDDFTNAVESLTDDLVELQNKLNVANNTISSYKGLDKKITDQAIKIKQLEVFERKYNVASNDLKKSQDQVVRLKAVQVKPAAGGVKKKAITSKQFKHATALWFG